MKERLTKREKNGLAYFPMCFTPPCNGEGCKDENCIFISDVCERLAGYEDLEEQGRLLRLPCKVGDTAWYLSRSGICEVEIDSFVVNINIFVNVSYYIGCERFGKTLTPYKTLFFSREEAEAKLKEMEGRT